MRHAKYIAVSTALTALFALGLNYGQQLVAEVQVRPAAVSDQDREFVSKAVKAGLAEVALGKLAIARSSNSNVKHLGEYVVETHDRTNAALATMAKAKGIALPENPGNHYQELGELLRIAEGAEFDRLYLYGAALSNQIEAAALFEQQATNGKDPDLRDFAKTTLASIRKNIEIIRLISSRGTSPHRAKKSAVYV